jgi:triosephosphate isomerase
VRRPLIVGNWKMNLNRRQAVELAEAVARGVGANGPADVAVCPPSVYLNAVGAALRGSRVGLGAQNVYHQPDGAFTGELSTAMLKDVGCRFVIVGHSERRHILGETNADVNQKLLAVLATGLTPILCVGEKLEERQSGRTQDVVREQLETGLEGVSTEDAARVVIAYEPVWAIGTGVVATPDQAEEVHADLRRLLASRYNDQTAAGAIIQYGGSVKPDNAAQLLGQKNIDGFLVGGASLKADSFLAIVGAAK